MSFVTLNEAINLMADDYTKAFWYYRSANKCCPVSENLHPSGCELAIIPVSRNYEGMESCRRLYENTGVKITAYSIMLYGTEELAEKLILSKLKEGELAVLFSTEVNFMTILSSLRSYNISVHSKANDFYNYQIFDPYEAGALNANFVLHGHDNRVWHEKLPSNIHRGRLKL